MLEPLHLGGDSKRLCGSETEIYLGSAPREEVKAYVLLGVCIDDVTITRGRNSHDLALDDS